MLETYLIHVFINRMLLRFVCEIQMFLYISFGVFFSGIFERQGEKYNNYNCTCSDGCHFDDRREVRMDSMNRLIAQEGACPISLFRREIPNYKRQSLTKRHSITVNL
ncbi:MAG: hypothetical protein DRJ05_00475 [Bacteroidetes bacterium]|nr:MAG: hypothetical protein DRJ05_00475 [Bacteroidota bacterium]